MDERGNKENEIPGNGPLTLSLVCVVLMGLRTIVGMYL